MSGARDRSGHSLKARLPKKESWALRWITKQLSICPPSPLPLLPTNTLWNSKIITPEIMTNKDAASRISFYFKCELINIHWPGLTMADSFHQMWRSFDLCFTFFPVLLVLWVSWNSSQILQYDFELPFYLEFQTIDAFDKIFVKSAPRHRLLNSKM